MPLMLAMEYAPLGNLRDWLRRRVQDNVNVTRAVMLTHMKQVRSDGQGKKNNARGKGEEKSGDSGREGDNFETRETGQPESGEILQDSRFEQEGRPEEKDQSTGG